MEASYLAVARFRKPHGLKGDAQLYPLTDEPEEVFVEGRVLVPVDEAGNAIGRELVIHHARPYQRCWLVGFEGITERAMLEGWVAVTLGAAVAELRPPEHGEMYLHEIPGATVVEGNTEIGVVKEVIGAPSNQIMVVMCEGRDCLVPLREPIVKRLDRENRRIEVELPPGLLEV